MITRCYFCGGSTSRELVTAEHWWGGELALFQHVPADVCQQCGERYYDAETVGRMDEQRQRKRPNKTVAVPVFDLTGVPVPTSA
jgi:YgiT-type zinc finger domain-containing protein